MIPALPVVCLLGFLHIVAFLKKFAHRREIETDISCGFFFIKASHSVVVHHENNAH